MSGAADRLVGLLGSLLGRGTDEDGPGDLNYDEATLRVWVETPEHAPPGRPTHRCPGGLHYYDVPVDEIDSGVEPLSFVHVEAFDAGDGATEHPYGQMAEKMWVPYKGERGGTGWKNTDTGEVTYDDEPPGETADDLIKGDSAVDTPHGEMEPGAFFTFDAGGETRAYVFTGETKNLGGTEMPVSVDVSSGVEVARPPKDIKEVVNPDAGPGGAEGEASDFDDGGKNVDIKDIDSWESMGDDEVRAAIDHFWDNGRPEREEIYDVIGMPPTHGGEYEDEGVDAFEMSSTTSDVATEYGTVSEFERERGSGRLDSRIEEAYESFTGDSINMDSMSGEAADSIRDEVRNHVVFDLIWHHSAGRSDELLSNKEWVPYTGPQGGSGWEDTLTGRVDYGDEKPSSPRVDPDALEEDDLASAEIQETQGWVRQEPEEFDIGDDVGYTDKHGRGMRGKVMDRNEDGSLTVDTDRGVTQTVDGGTENLSRQSPIFMGSGIAGAGTPWLSDEPEEPSRVQLAAEAVRSAAATTEYGDTEPLESFGALALSRGADEDDVEAALDFAADHHPVLNEPELEGALEGARALAESGLSDRELVEEHYDQAASAEPPGEQDVDGEKASSPATGKAWVPYEGPQGGSGWKNTEDGQVVYDDEPPGETIEPGDVAEPTHPVKSFGELHEGNAIEIGTHEGETTGLILATNEEEDPLGNPERSVDILLEDGTEETLTMDDLRRAATVRTSPPDREDTGSPLGVDYSKTEVKGGSYRSGGYEILATDERRALGDNLRKKHGREPVEQLSSLTDSWKGSSYTDDARAREKAFADALGLDGPLRNDGLKESVPVTPEMAEVASDLTEASRAFMREHHADEDGNIEVHRGLSSRVGTNLQEQIFERFASGGGADEPAQMNLNAMDNYSIEESTARGWADYTALITEKRPVDDVVVATDFVQTNGGEGEVSMEGGDRDIDLSQIQVQGDWNAADLFEGDLDEQDRVNVMKTMRHLMGKYERRLNADDSGYYDDKPERDLPGKPPNPAVLDATERFIEETREEASGDSAAVQNAQDALADGFEEIQEGGDYIMDALQPTVRKVADGDAWMDLQEHVPFGSDDPEEWADAMATGIPNSMDKGAADKVMEVLTGQPGLTVGIGDTYAQDFADETEDDLEKLRRAMERRGEGPAGNPDEQAESLYEVAGGDDPWQVRNAIQDAVDRERWLEISAAADEAADESGDGFYTYMVDQLEDREVFEASQALGKYTDEKAGVATGSDIEVDFTSDPANIDWIARSRDGPPEGARLTEKLGVEKSWVPYTGPQGGSGWQNLDTGEVTYQDDPPGDTLGPEELVAAAEEAGYDTEEVRESLEELEDAEPADEDAAPEPLFGREITPEDKRVAAILAGTDQNAVKNWYVDAVGGVPSDTPSDPLQAAVDIMDATDRGWNGQSRVPDPDDLSRVDKRVEQVDKIEDRLAQTGSEAGERALRSLAEADASDLDEEQFDKVLNQVEKDGSNAVSPETAERVIGAAGTYKATGTGDSNNRAYFSGRQRHSTNPGAARTGVMALGEKGSSTSTITHEFGHGMAHAFAFDHPGERKTAHNWRDDRGREVRREGWDFGGKHDDKKDYLLTSYGAWEDRGDHGWDEYESLGEEVSMEDLSIGDRVAVRAGAGDIVEGTVMPNDRPVEDVSTLEPGEKVSTSEGENMSGRGWGTVTEGIEGGEVESVVPAGSYIVIREETTHPLGENQDPDEVRNEPGVIDVIRASKGGALVRDEESGEYDLVDADDITEASEHPAGFAVKNANTGDETRLTEDMMDLGALRMAGASGRDWVPVRDFKDSLRGEAVRFKFGAQDRSREGVVTDESGGQVLVEFVDGNGNANSRWVNKNQSFQQSVWVAEDRKEFKDPSPSENPPGWDRARYETLEITERDVDWDTHVQYEDQSEVVGKLTTGDMMLLGIGGERVPVKVTDARVDTYGATDSIELDVNYPTDAAEQLRDAGVGEPYIQFDGEYGQITLDDDIKVWGHAEREQFIPSEYEGAELDDFVGDPEDLGNGDIIQFTRSSDVTPFGTDAEKTAMVTGFGQFTGGDRYIEVDDGHKTKTMSLESVDIEGVKPAAESAGGASVKQEWEEPPRNMLELAFDDVSAGSATGFREPTVEVKNAETGETVTGQMKGIVVSTPDREFDKTFRVDIHTEDGDKLHAEYGVQNMNTGLLQRLDEYEHYTGDTRKSDRFDVTGVKAGEVLSGAGPYTAEDTSGLEPGTMVEFDRPEQFGDGERTTGEVEEVLDDDTARLTDGTVVHADDSLGEPFVRRAGKPAETDGASDSEPPDPEEAAENLFEEVNVAWWKMATKRNEGRAPTPPGSDYAETNTQETLAMTHQSMQGTGPSKAIKIAENHPDLMMAYLDVFEPSGEVKEALNDWHDESWRSPFDDTPFPEAEPEEAGWGEVAEMIREGGIENPEENSLSAVRSFADGRGVSVPGPDEIDWEGVSFTNRRTDDEMTVRSVVEGDLLAEDGAGNDVWVGAAEAYRYATLGDVMGGAAGAEPPNKGSTGRVPDGYSDNRTGIVMDTTSQSVIMKPVGSDETVTVPLEEFTEANQ